MELSLFSVCYAGLWGQQALDTVAFIAKASRLGYDAVMLMGKRPHLSPLDAAEGQLAAVKEALQQSKISCAAIAGYTDFADTAAAEVPYLEMQIAYLESLARIAAELGGSVVRVFTAYEVEGQSLQATWQRVVSGLVRSLRPRRSTRDHTGCAKPPRSGRAHRRAAGTALATWIGPTARSNFDAWSPAL